MASSPEDESEMGKQQGSANKSKKTSARSDCGEMERLPNDLIVEIFSRLPSKSVARFCTVSKHWESTLTSPDFAKLFLSKSWTRPRLLFAVKQFDEWQFFSTPQQSQNPSSHHVEFHSKFSGDVSRHMCSHASGLFYFPYVQILDEEALLIFNPITGLYVRLPNLQRPRPSKGFLGFDPIDKQFKVLSEIRQIGQIRAKGPLYQNILTLGTGELSWKSYYKTAEYVPSLFNEGICINGIVYFLGKIDGGVSTMVCFDVRTEEFNFIKVEWFNDHLEDPWAHFSYHTRFTLVNYKGKLAGIYWKCADDTDGRRTVKLLVWVLEDAEKQEWSKDVYILPENEVLSSCDFSVAGVTSNGNIVLVMKYMCKPFYVFYFNPERNTLQSVMIQGFGADLKTVEDCPGELRTQVHAYVDHVDDLSVNTAKQLKSNISQITSICPCCKEGEAGGSISNGRCRRYCKEKLRRKRRCSISK